MTDAQKQAGYVTMRGSFKFNDVMQALQRAGVPTADLVAETDALLTEAAANNIIRREAEDRWVRV